MSNIIHIKKINQVILWCFFNFIKQLCTTIDMVMVNTAEITFGVRDFRRSLPWQCGPSWVVPVDDREKKTPSVVCRYSAVCRWLRETGVPREWTGSEHKEALLPCLTGGHCGTGMEPRVHTGGWTRLRTVRVDNDETTASLWLVLQVLCSYIQDFKKSFNTESYWKNIRRIQHFKVG